MQNNSNTNKGKSYENKIKKLLKKLSSKPIHGEKRVKTIAYEGFRKIDIGLGVIGNKDYEFFEAKNWKSITDVSAIDHAAGIKRALKTEKAGVISNSKYSQNAINQAKSEGLDLYHYINPKDKSIKVGAKILTYNSFIFPNSIKYKCYFGENILEMHANPRDVKLDNDENIASVFSKLWNEKKLNFDEGKHSYEYEVFNIASSHHDNIKTIPVDKIEFTYMVSFKNYIYKTEISKGTGLYDVINEYFVFPRGEILFGPISIKRILSEGELTIQPPDKYGSPLIGIFSLIMDEKTIFKKAISSLSH
jgi:hypothetical protein